MKRIISFLAGIVLLCSSIRVQADDVKLYAKAAVLMDAESGKVLYGKSEKKKMANASTTKILTCLYIIEHCNLEEEAEVSQNAASQPQVRLGVRKGEKYKVKDLLYGLMLESYNDCAVVLAEHAEGSTEKFAEKINQEAKKAGAKNTHFVTPNGLDASDDQGEHHTTAADLALIMRYCIRQSPKAQEFLAVTQTDLYTFWDVEHTQVYTCSNHNSFLQMMDGALSGKTGFTSKAGYCYVGALERDGKCLIVALLACGWPNAKSYKWTDTRKLMTYGLENYFYKTDDAGRKTRQISVENAAADGFPGDLTETVTLLPDGQPPSVLRKEGEEITEEWEIPESVEAPIEKGEELGTVRYSLDGTLLLECRATADRDVKERTFSVCAEWIKDRFFFRI